MSENNLNKIS